jgi:ribose transport system ATP-binding protein
VSELLAIDGLTKRFGGIAALQDVSLRLGAGGVLALCGANGAGKSTLVRILAGVETPDAGEIRIDGEPVTIASPQDATRLGLNFIHQELNLVPKFSALQNMALGYEGAARRGLLDRRAARRRANEVVARLGADFDLDAQVQDLTVSQRWMVSLGRSLMREGARVIAMDEPTASFTEAEAERLFSIISDLTAGGVAVLYISHRLDEVLHVSDDVTVLRNGRLVGTFAVGEIDRARLTREIVGQEVAELEAIPTSDRPLEARPVVLSARGLAREPRVRGVSLDVHAGEILGVAGLVGAGRTEVARLLFGADAPSAGTMELGGKAYAPRSPYDAIRRGVALVPEERRSEGLLLQESVAFNIGLATAKENRRGGAGLGLLSPGRARATAREMVSRFGIKVASVDQPVGALSGGNQQKVVVSKYVRAGPKLLILDEPTVGVDVGARGELYAIIRDLAEAGAAVIVISSDFEELAICERVAVMREGRVVAMVDAAHATKDHLTSLCYSEEIAV